MERAKHFSSFNGCKGHRKSEFGGAQKSRPLMGNEAWAVEISEAGGGVGARRANADASGGGRAAAAHCEENLRSRGSGRRWRPGL